MDMLLIPNDAILQIEQFETVIKWLIPHYSLTFDSICRLHEGKEQHSCYRP